MKDILKGFGPDTPKSSAPTARSGGITSAGSIPYCPPVGPSNIGDPKSPGLHGTNHGNNPK